MSKIVSKKSGSEIYDKDADGGAIKLAPKVAFSGEYKERKNLRVSAYARVSTDSDEQQVSLDTQLSHYGTYIAGQENWIFRGIYVDEGISGTSTKKRHDFNRMIADAKAGKFDMIITKSVSRFARNLVDGLQTSRMLLQLKPPVGIFFEEEGLNTFRPDSEFLLSVMLLIAQAESEKKSAAIRKAYQWRCDDEDYLTPVNSLLGYTKNEDKKMLIEPEGAKTVKAIYALYLHGLTATHIAYLLTASGKLTGKNRPIWTPSSVINIIRNERYCGDLVAQKTVTTNILEHISDKNIGQAALHYKDNHHEGIVTRDEHIRGLLLLRANSASKHYNPNYEIEVVREGLLKGFIPLNFAFGGYEAEHYLGAELACNLKQNNYAVEILNIPEYRVVRTQEIEHRLAAQMTVSQNSITFNSDCVSRLAGVEYVEVLLHPTERLIAVRKTDKDNKNAIVWCPKSISASSFCPVLFKLCGWNDMWKYKFMTDCFVRGNEQLLMFNLSEPELLFVDEITDNEEIKARIKRMLLPNDWRDNIGADYISHIVASRRAYALSLEDWKSDTPALPVPGFVGNPSQRSKAELTAYLETLGVKYE